MFRKSIIFLLLLGVVAFGDVFKNSSSLIFTLPVNKWQFEFNPARYGVSAAGFLAGQRWTNSPVILYCEIIPTNYQFDLYTQIQKFQKTSKIKGAQYQPSRIALECPVPYEVTYWSVKDVVYEYVTYFSLNNDFVASIVLSSKRNDVLIAYLEDYKVILQNFAKIAGSFKKDIIGRRVSP
ncbi:MAG: hypothetical protein WCH76_00225 [Candidatus Riflemargulisbacteria bacterium]